MKKFGLLFLLLTFQSLPQVASDDASNYGTWTNGSNGGSGFSTWSFSNTGNAGQFLGSSSSQGFGDIDVASKSFGMYGNTSGSDYSNSSRTFSSALADGNTFKISLAIAFRNGNKGIDILEGATARFNFNVGSDLYSAQGSDLGWSYSQTSIVVLEVTQLNSTTIYVRLTRGSDIYNSGNITTTGNLTGFKLYCGATAAGDLNNLFFNSLEIRNTTPLPVELTSFSASVKNKSVNLVWHTATEINNYGFEIEKRQSSIANSQWSKVGFVNGNGNSNSANEYSYTDKTVTSGKYTYRLKQIDNDGQYEYSKEVEVDLGKPTTFALNQNYPNPFNPSTSIQYSLVGSQYVSLKVFNVLGKEVALLVNEKQEPGTYTVDFTSANLSGGAYFYRLQAGEFVQTKKMILLK